MGNAYWQHMCRSSSHCLVAVVLVLAAAVAWAQEPSPANGILLVAKPGLADPRFRETVILVTQTQDAQTVGVILNRPTSVALDELIEDPDLAENYDEPVFYGGPVLGRTLVALFESSETPDEPAFHVLRNVYLSMHPALIESLLSEGQARFRLYAGFSGWAPGQLQSEIERGGWYALPATPALVFRKDTRGMWKELLDKARSGHAAATKPRAILPL